MTDTTAVMMTTTELGEAKVNGRWVPAERLHDGTVIVLAGHDWTEATLPQAVSFLVGR
jgi:hypothetical protein